MINKYTLTSMAMMLDTTLSDSAKMLYIVLKGLAEDLNFIQISEAELSRLRDTSDRTVRRGLVELEENGLIAKYRRTLKDIQIYVIIPYEIRKVITLNTENEFEELLREITSFIDGEYSPVVTANVPTQSVQAEEREFNARDYCKYFAEQVRKKKGYEINIGNPQVMSIMRRVTKDKPKEDNLLMIDTFIDIYDLRFKKPGFEYPTVQSFGASWIYNIVLGVAMERKREMESQEEILDIEF